MSQNSLVLDLPYIQPAQAQKHVTHNEALRRLDVVVQLSVESAVQPTPPETPDEGARFIVPAVATGAWVDNAHDIALWDTGAWRFITPQAGWVAMVRDTGAQNHFDGSAWVSLGADVTEVQNATAVGVGTSADAANPLAAAGPATLLTHTGAGHQLKINKSAGTDTASLLFQTDWGGRAEMGTAGSDDFSIKTSADGSTWHTGASFDAATGCVRFPAGAKVPNRVEVGGRFYCFANNRWVTHQAGYGVQSENHSADAGTGATPSPDWSHMGVFLPQGASLQSLGGCLRSNSNEVTGFDIAVYFQSGPLDTGWNSASPTVSTAVASQTGTTFLPGWNRLALDLGGFTAPEDGFALFYLRPIGTITGTRYIYSALALEYLTAG